MRRTIVTGSVFASAAMSLLFACGDDLNGTCTDTSTCAPDGSTSEGGDAVTSEAGDGNVGGKALGAAHLKVQLRHARDRR